MLRTCFMLRARDLMFVFRYIFARFVHPFSCTCDYSLYYSCCAMFRI